jgi:hypothetical protein
MVFAVAAAAGRVLVPVLGLLVAESAVRGQVRGRQIPEAAAGEAFPVISLVFLLGAQEAQALSASGGLNKENKNELCTHQQ